MREILFKAKACNGEWVQGLLAHKDNKWYISNKAGMPFAYEVRPDTICQYTGLTDKNGNKIWDNDVIKTDCGNVRVIYSAEPSPYENSFNVGFEVLFNNITDNENYRRDVGYWACYRGFGVIGNIFDNPELLGV